MQINKDELFFANAFIDEQFSRIVEWSVGDIKRCCRMNSDGTCADDGALVAAFILWTCAIDYFGGLYTGLTGKGATKARFKEFITKYMKKYDFEKVEDLRWSLAHYYSPHHFVLYHENNLAQNKDIHLTNTSGGIMLHLGWSIKDLEDGVEAYRNELVADDTLKIKLWRYYKEQLPIMPVKVERLISPTLFASMATGTTIHSMEASGTVNQSEWLKNNGK